MSERMEALLTALIKKVDRLETKVDDILNDYDPEDNPPPKRESFDDEIYAKGDRVPYNRLDGDQLTKFREFLAYVRMHEDQFSQKEIDYASFADKNFSDTRLSDNMKRILEQAYFRIYRKQWNFTFVKGYLFKWQGQKAWRWADGLED
jgi:hypothetical protein